MALVLQRLKTHLNIFKDLMEMKIRIETNLFWKFIPDVRHEIREALNQPTTI